MHGAYTCLPRQVDRLTELFDAGWRLADKPPASAGLQNVTVADLFNWGKPNGSGRNAGAPALPTATGLTGMTGGNDASKSGSAAAVLSEDDPSERQP